MGYGGLPHESISAIRIWLKQGRDDEFLREQIDALIRLGLLGGRGQTVRNGAEGRGEDTRRRSASASAHVDPLDVSRSA